MDEADFYEDDNMDYEMNDNFESSNMDVNALSFIVNNGNSNGNSNQSNNNQMNNDENSNQSNNNNN